MKVAILQEIWDMKEDKRLYIRVLVQRGPGKAEKRLVYILVL